MEPAAAPSPEAAKPTPASTPVMDVVAPPPAAPDEQPAAGAKPEVKPILPTPKPNKKPPTPKEPGNGVGLAIFGTIVIVLGLAALATYAYLKTR